MSQVPATRTPATPQQVADALVAAWPSQLGGAPTLPQICVLLAQCGLETEHGVECIQWNIGNAKWSGTGDFCEYPTDEYINGVKTLLSPPDPGCRFQAYASLEDGVADYLRGMWKRWTKAWPSVIAGDPAGFAAGLKAQGYYTAPVEEYAAGVEAYFKDYMGSITLSGTPTRPSLT
jgi:flagellum-specific peptidoglycan hydrolase FlgJ